MVFISFQNLFLFLRFLFFSLTFWSKRLYQKTEVNFKIYGVTDWQTNNYTTHLAQYLKKERKTDNEILLLSRI